MIHVIINPHGAGGATAKTWVNARQILRDNHVSFKAHFSREDYDIDQIARDLCTELLVDDNSELTLFVIGGDGSMNLVVNGITDFSRVKVGFIPCGSGNDLAHSIGLTKNVDEEMPKILNGEVERELDIGEVICDGWYDENDELISDEPRRRLFNISCGIGFDAGICWEVETTSMKGFLNRLKLGKLSYLAAGMKTVFGSERVPADITIDGVTKHFDKLLFAAGMNAPYEGGGFMFGPGAKADDGIMELCVTDGLSSVDFFRIFPLAYKGNHVKFKGVSVHEGREIDIRVGSPSWVHTDGEVSFKAKHITIGFCDQKLRLLN